MPSLATMQTVQALCDIPKVTFMCFVNSIPGTPLEDILSLFPMVNEVAMTMDPPQINITNFPNINALQIYDLHDINILTDEAFAQLSKLTVYSSDQEDIEEDEENPLPAGWTIAE